MSRYNSHSIFTSTDTTNYNDEKVYADLYTGKETPLELSGKERYTYKSTKKRQSVSKKTLNWIVTRREQSNEILAEHSNKMIDVSAHIIHSEALSALEKPSNQEKSNYGQHALNTAKNASINGYKATRTIKNNYQSFKMVGESIYKFTKVIMSQLSILLKAFIPFIFPVVICVFLFVCMIGLVSLVPTGIGIALEDFLSSLTKSDLDCEEMNEEDLEVCEYLKNELFPDMEIKEEENAE